jgi:anion-transporting  ArsA/GET3 family ATPase
MTAQEGLAAVLDGKRVVICAGSGGVGKTTTAAAIAMAMATRGLKVAVVTIDPARRLADALGLERLEDAPHRVDPARFSDQGIQMRGELWAMMLDPKRTFDALIERLAPDARARDEVLSNHIYQQLSTAVAGSQEFTAIAKLYELDADGAFDLVVLDTPPSRNALDFLDAPGRLTSFFQGRAIRLFLRPAGIGSRLMGAGTGAVFSLMRRATGIDLLEDLSVFFRSLASMVDGFAERARHVEALLADPATSFVVVTSPERGPLEEAIFLVRRLERAGMSLGALLVNRLREADTPPSTLPASVTAQLGDDLAGRVVAAVEDRAALAARDRRALARLQEETGRPATFKVPQMSDDVHDVAGLSRVAAHLT